MNKGIWIFVIIVLIVVIYFINKKNKTVEIPNAVQNLVQNSGLGNIISSGSGSNMNNTTGNNTATLPVVTVSGFKFGDKIYAKDNLVNTYKSANNSSTNLASYTGYSQGTLIGTYLGKDGVFTKVLIASPASSVYVLSNQIYSK